MTRARCTHWVFGDRIIYEQTHPTYAATIWTAPEIVDAMRSDKVFDPGAHDWHYYPEMYDRYPCVMDGMTWPTYSLAAALVVAAFIGATSIDIYGDDRTNQPDFDGQNANATARTPQRWSEQAAFESPVRQRLASEGIGIRQL